MYDRFWNKVQRGKSDECWPFKGARDKDGYGLLKASGKSTRAHRISYTIHIGPIPDKMLICHTCDNPGCVNPNHLFLGTQKDNVMDSATKGRHKCPDNQGEEHGMSKLTKDDIREIRRLASIGLSGRKLAKMWNISPTHANAIVARKRWRHV